MAPGGQVLTIAPFRCDSMIPKCLSRKSLRNARKVFAKQKLFAENPALGTEFHDLEAFSAASRKTLRDNRPIGPRSA
ncbi:MAG TPA: hypothetical protein VFI65_15625, partial [Streptosporangiaceae bacterium]|nr:hypothetical protein [Streptosporangiaceae bacterium]